MRFELLHAHLGGLYYNVQEDGSLRPGLQLNIAYYLPSIPLLVVSAFLDKPLEERLGEPSTSTWALRCEA